MQAAIISTYTIFTRALQQYLEQLKIYNNFKLLYKDFNNLDPQEVEPFDHLFFLSHSIIDSRVLDIGYHWAYHLTDHHIVFLLDTYEQSDFIANPIILNPIKDISNYKFHHTTEEMPLRPKKIRSSYLCKIQGLFRAHGHSGFMGELGKLQSYLIGGLEFYEDDPDNSELQSLYFYPCIKFMENLLRIFAEHQIYLTYWFDKQTIFQIKLSIKKIRQWKDLIGAGKIKLLDSRSTIEKTLSVLESNILSFKA